MKKKAEKRNGKISRTQNQKTDLSGEAYREINLVSFKQNFQALVGNFKKNQRPAKESRPFRVENISVKDA